MNNRKVYLISLMLVLLGGALIALKVSYGGHSVERTFSPHLWRINIVMNIKGQGVRGKVRLTLPKDNPHQTVYNEHFENSELVFYVRETPISGNRLGYWRAELLEGVKTLEYTFSAQLRETKYEMPSSGLIPGKPTEVYDEKMQKWLKPSRHIQSSAAALRRHLKKIMRRERNAAVVTRRIFDFVRGEVQYRSEKGSKDARLTLDKLVADCGGQARLFVALSRAAGIPSRVVGGLILSGGTKDTTHVWAENYLGNQWIPFDVVNGHFAVLPAHYLELYRGDYALIKHTPLAKFEYFFFIGEEKVPPLDNPWSLYVLPIHFQAMVKRLLLIPVGAVVVAFFRTIVGIPTFGTFTPILLSIALREVSLLPGLTCLGIILTLGWGLRKILDHLKILMIPRLAIVLTLVVLLVLGIMILGFRLNQQRFLFISLFPMVIMTWMIERFSVLEIEDGTPTALKTAFGSTFVSVITYYIFGLHAVRAYLFAFPELLFVVMAGLLLMGRYTGIRILELWRFKELGKVLRAAKRKKGSHESPSNL